MPKGKHLLDTHEQIRAFKLLVAERITNLPYARAEIWIGIAVMMGLNGEWCDEIRDSVNDRISKETG